MTRTTPIFSMTPDYSPIIRLMAMQTRFAIETSQNMMKLAMLPWTGLPKGFASICTPMGSVAVATLVAEAGPAKSTVAKPEPRKAAEAAHEVIEAVATEVAEAPAPKAEKVAAPAAKAETPAETAPAPAAEKPAQAQAEAAPAPKPAPAPEPKAEAPAAQARPEAAAVAMAKPKAIPAPANPDDLTVLDGVGPKLAEALNAEGIYTYAQIAAWTEANVAWADESLPGVPGRASRNGWVAQAAGLAK